MNILDVSSVANDSYVANSSVANSPVDQEDQVTNEEEVIHTDNEKD